MENFFLRGPDLRTRISQPQLQLSKTGNAAGTEMGSTSSTMPHPIVIPASNHIEKIIRST